MLLNILLIVRVKDFKVWPFLALTSQIVRLVSLLLFYVIALMIFILWTIKPANKSQKDTLPDRSLNGTVF